MRVALLLSGAVRNIEDTYHSIKYHILDKFEQIDVFIYGVENKFSTESNIRLLEGLFSPKNIVINDISFYSDINHSILDSNRFHAPHPSFWSNSIRAYYNVKKVNELRKEYQRSNNFVYDLIIRTRMDLFWLRPITEEEIEISKSKIVLPWDWAFRSGPPWNGPNTFGYSDFYSISNDEGFDLYSSAYDSISEFSGLHNFHPESHLGYHLRNTDVYECKRHITTEYPVKELEICDSYGVPLGDEFYSPKIWSMVDLGCSSFSEVCALRKKNDK